MMNATPRHAIRLALLGLGLAAFAAADVRAAVLAGPTTFSNIGGSDTLWGIQFTAIQNSTLTGFDYNHRDPVPFGNPFTGTISVNDITASTTVYTSNYVANATDPLAFTGLTVSLIAGHSYQLVATSDIVSNANDEVFEYITPFGTAPAYPTSNSDITVTQGVFTASPGFSDSFAWGAFTNIATTSVSPTPEPSTFACGITAAVFGLAYSWRSRRRAAAG